MNTKIQKWGNSLGVRLPKDIAEQKQLTEGASVRVVLQNGKIVIEPTHEQATLADLVSRVSSDNLHTETDWASVQGKEIW